MNNDLNCLSYWFPKILAAGLPVPRTEMVSLDGSLIPAIFSIFDGDELPDSTAPFFQSLWDAAARIGFPCFMRTGQTSGKHHWKNTCFVEGPDRIQQQALNLIEFSELAGLIGLPWNVWCLRELLPTVPLMIATQYGDMPIAKEFRAFVKDGALVCLHPYWPLESLQQGLRSGGVEQREIQSVYDQLANIGDAKDEAEVSALAVAAGKAVGGSWSVDVLATTRGWFVTDMAVASDSYHWPNCDRAEIFGMK